MSRWHSTTVNFQTPSTEYQLEIIRHPDEEGQDCIAGKAARVRVYRYAPTGILQSEVDAGSRSHSHGMLEERNEVVEFKYGWAGIEKWNQWGRKRVYSGALLRRESYTKNHQYKVPFQDITIRRDTPGDVKLRAWFGLSADPEIEAEITLNFLDPATADPVSGETPLIQAARTDSGPIHPGVSHTVRVYHWHPDDVSPSKWTMAGATATAGASGTELITEAVEFRSGVGSISVFDSNGIRERIRDDLADQRIAYAEVTYSAPYKDYSVSGASADTPYAVFWYWDSGEEAAYQFQATEPQPGDFPDQSSCEAAGFYWYNGACNLDPEPADPGGYDNEADCVAAGNYWYAGACHLVPPTPVDRTLTIYDAFTDAPKSGVSVYVDEILIGTTNAMGQVTATGLNQGQTYSVRATKAGEIIATDADEIANDEFVA